jgi:PKD repeat protein
MAQTANFVRTRSSALRLYSAPVLKRSRKAAAPTGLSAAIVSIAFAAGAATLLAAPAQAAPPVAQFDVSPSTPRSFDPVTFTSTSFDPDGDEITETQWDLNTDPDFEVSGPTASRTYSRANTFHVALRVVAGGEESILASNVTVINRPPEASIAAIPSNPLAGQEVTFVSTSSDLDGAIASQDWDLDGDGFDDGDGVYVTKIFPAPGQYTVRLLVVDKEDPPASTVADVGVIVGAAGSGGGQVIGASTLRLMTPFPIVRMSGLVRRRGIKLRLLTVNAPIGASVSFRCRGRGCPFKRRTRLVKPPKKKSAGGTATAGQVRIRRFPRRLVRAGATVSVYVTKPGSIGKFTRFLVRRGRPPARRDRCLPPVGTTPIPCPSG